MYLWRQWNKDQWITSWFLILSDFENWSYLQVKQAKLYFPKKINLHKKLDFKFDFKLQVGIFACIL